MGQQTPADNLYLLILEDKATKFLFAISLPSKEALGLARALLEVTFAFDLPVSLRSDMRRCFEFTHVATRRSTVQLRGHARSPTTWCW